MPELPTGCSGVSSGFQLLKSPMTLTLSAFGAHTAKFVPSRPVLRRGCAPNLSYSRWCLPSLNRYRSSFVRTVRGFFFFVSAIAASVVVARAAAAVIDVAQSAIDGFVAQHIIEG